MTSSDQPARLARLREQHPWVDHLAKAAERYDERYGAHYAAAVTYFSVLSLVPLLMIAFAVAGFVLASRPDLLAQLQGSISKAVPGSLGDTINSVVAQALKSKSAVGVFGLLGAFYSGLGWMGNLRDALTAQWGHDKQSPPFLKRMWRDLLALLGLGLSMVLSFGITAAGGGFATLLLDLVGLRQAAWAKVLLVVVTVLLSLAANWLVFLWVLAKLPRKPVSWRSAVRGALAAAVGFEVLKQVGSIYLSSVTKGPAGSAFGPIIGVLVFAYLVSQFLLFVTAWTATAPDNVRPEPVSPPPPAVIRPLVRVGGRPDARTTAGLLGVGALAGLALRGAFQRRR